MARADGEPIRFRVVPQEEGLMLSHLLARRLPDIGKDDGRALIAAGAVYVGHLRVRMPSVRVAPGERITVYPQALAHQELPVDAISIVHRDPAFVVLDKACGVPVSATRGSARGTLNEALRRRLVQEGVVRPYVGVVHRLDTGASGLVMMTVRGVANKSLQRQFAQHHIARSYRVLVHGTTETRFEANFPLVENRSGGSRVARSGERRAKPASTRFQRLRPARASSVAGGVSLLDVELLTGRTHQIRVHAAELGHPVVGDHRYGTAKPDGQALAALRLHAYKLEFDHPIDGTHIVVESALPDWAKSSASGEARGKHPADE